MKGVRAAVLLLSLGLAAATDVVAQQPAGLKGDAERAKGKVSMCIGCHGIPGYRSVFPEVFHVPLIGGQNPGYIVSALKAYQAGERNHPSMTGIAKGLSEQDMADIAAYYGGSAK